MTQPNDYEVIYCLAEIGGDPFYVGRSEDPKRRLREHRYGAKKGTEVKYQHIRKLWAANKDFELVILEEYPKERYEKYYHYILGCEYDLTNQKMGDTDKAEQAAHTAMREAGRSFATASEFLDALDIEMREAKARKAAAKVQARIRCEVDDTERTLIVGEKLNERFESPAMKAIRARKELKEYEDFLKQKKAEWTRICVNTRN